MSNLVDEYRARLVKAMAKLVELEAELDATRRVRREPVAIIGMGCRFPPGVGTPEAYFAALEAGEDAISEVPPERFPVSPDAGGARYGGFVKDVDRFDAAFFGMSPREAQSLDPQQRLLLEVAFEALERAGQVPSRAARAGVGVFVGLTATDYAELSLQADPEARDVYTVTGNGHCFAAGRLAYSFGFQGPTLTVDTACSSSLVAVHLAAKSLRDGECALALAAGVNLILSPTAGLLLHKTNALSRDGRCKAFDAGADGFVRGEGCGVLVLKRLSDAHRDGDPVLAIVRGSAVNQDGRSTGITTPNVLAQRAMLEQALADAGIPAADLGYIETHGTGTSLGDPIELEALRAVIGAPRPDGSRCVLGAVKTNVGHLEAAAGMAGLVKAVMCLERGLIPRNLHFQALNPRMSLAGTCFDLATEARPWPAGGRPRLAGVSAFGLSGTNAHVILEEPPRVGPAAPPLARPELVLLSARSPEALAARAVAVAEAAAGLELADLAYTAAVRRGHDEHRLAVVAGSTDELAAALAAYARGEAAVGVKAGAAAEGPRRVFVFSGQGSQWSGMALGLMGEPVFRAAFAAIDALVPGGISLRERLDDTEVAQPAIFAVEVALAALLASWGVAPDAVIGHSVGEVAAAHVAGALPLADAVRLVCLRGRVMQPTKGRGRMAAVQAGAEEVAEALAGFEERLSVAAVNAPRSRVIAGEPEALDEALARLAARGVRTKRLAVEYAFHGPQMASCQRDFAAGLGALAVGAPTLPFFSTVTGAQERVLDAGYWARNLREPVRFADAVAAAGPALFVEIGPQPVLALDVGPGTVATLRRGRDERRCLLETLAALHVAGSPVDWERVYPTGRVVPLPAYPWQRQRHWLPSSSPVPAAAPPPPPRPADAPELLARVQAAAPGARLGILTEHVQRAVERVMGIVPPARAPLGQGLFDLGMDSLMAVELGNQLGQTLGRPVVASAVFEHPSIEALARHLHAELAAAPLAAVTRPRTAAPHEPIAIIGMACRFPGGGNDPEAFWRVLTGGRDAISEVPDGRWDRDAFLDADRDAPGKTYTSRSGFLVGHPIDRFDSSFFNLSPLEANGLDPQQRMLLELTWEALEHAGQSPDRLVGSATGVYVGIATADYGYIMAQEGLAKIDPWAGMGNSMNTAAGRLSYFLGLRGPSVALDTACSSSLVAAHLGVQSLRGGECDLVIVGGVNLILAPIIHVMYARMGALAPDGRCKAFDAAADGMVRGEGGGVMILKRERDARAAGDRILAVIRGSAVNHDGRSSGLTVPNGGAQRAVVRAALADAGVAPGAIALVETHGTGTTLGDPIEANALAAELGRGRETPLHLGAAKATVGHLEAAAGMVGLVKVVLALEHGAIPPHPHFATLNPQIQPGDCPLVVPTEMVSWPAGAPRFAGVSSFGVSGTNAHLILGDAPPSAEAVEAPEAAAWLLPLSARSPEALRELAAAYRELLERAPLADVCASAALRRAHLEHRLAVTGRTRAELLEALDAFLAGELHPRFSVGALRPGQPPSLAFVFSGHGGHWTGMGRQLFAREPVFRDAFLACAAALERHGAGPLSLDAEEIEARLPHLVFALGVALAALWRSWGIVPAAVVGHSMGEITAAHVAGALGLDDAARLCCRRSELLARLEGTGAMGTVGLSLADTRAALAGLEDKLSVAVSNSRASTVVSGDPAALGELLARLGRGNVFARPLKGATNAGHSPRLDPLLPELVAALEGLAPRPAEVPLYSTVLARETTGEALGPGYWARNLREPVLFAQTIEKMGQEGLDTFLEIGPHPLLLTAIEQTLRPRGGAITLAPSLKAAEPETATMLASLGRLFVAGVPVDLAPLHPGGGRFAELPTYPWQRQRHWGPVKAYQATSRAVEAAGGHRLLQKHIETPREHVWESTLDVVSAGVLAEMALAAAAAVWPGEAALLEGLKLPEAAVPGTLQLALATEARTFQIASRRDGVWQVHATGRVAEAAPAPAPPSGPARVLSASGVAAAFDAGFQLLAGDGLLPSAIESLWLAGGRLPAELRCHAADGGFTLVGDDGRVVGRASGVRLAPPDRAVARRALAASWNDWLYGLVWQPAPRPEPVAPPAGRWLIVADSLGFGAALARRLEARGDGATLVAPDAAAGALRGDLRGVIHLAGLSAAEPEDTTVGTLVEDATGGAAALLALVQALARAGGPRFWMVTRNAQPAAPAPGLSVAQAPLWGLGKTIAVEHPDLWGRLIDLGADATPERAAEELCAELAVADDEELVALRGGARLVLRLVRTPPPPLPPAPLALRADAAYLVTGGLGGAGLELARWLVDRGARHLFLLGRRGPSAGDSAQQAALAALEASGAKVRILAADVGDRTQVATALRAVSGAGLRLRGLLHAAGVSAPMLLRDTTPEVIASLYRPKVLGAWVLHELTRGLELDFFVCFSSAAAVWGAAGLGPYAAANHFMDVLAHHRRALGLPALSVNWGGWAGRGMMTAEAQKLAADMGLGVTPPAQMLEALDVFLQARLVQTTIGHVDWHIFKPLFETRRRKPLFEHIEARAAVGDGGGFLRELLAAPPAGRFELLTQHVRDEAARVLGLEDARALDRTRGFFQLGMDSVMSVQLRNRLEQSLGRELPATLAFDHPSVEALATHLARELELPLPAAPSLDDLSAAELEALLAAELGEAT